MKSLISVLIVVFSLCFINSSEAQYGYNGLYYGGYGFRGLYGYTNSPTYGTGLGYGGFSDPLLGHRTPYRIYDVRRQMRTPTYNSRVYHSPSYNPVPYYVYPGR